MRAARLGGGRRCGANAARRSAPRAGARAAPTPPKHSRAAATVQPRWYDLNAAYKERTNYDKAAPPPHPPSAVIARGGGSEPIDGVFFLGHRSKGTFGAAGYLLLREGGNVLVDCARPDERLVDAVRALGGAKWHLMSHTDDVAGHHEWHDEMEVWLGAPEDELPASARSWAAGDGPWVLGGEDEGLVVHHVPGHSLGSVVLHMDDKVLFTGDHLAFSQRAKLLGFGSKHTRDYPAQIESVRALSGLPFEWVLPGHGRPYRVSPPTEENARLAIEGAANDMEAGLLDV